MGPRLASLALLLLTLCRTSSSTIQSWTDTNTVTESKISLGAAKIKAEMPNIGATVSDAAKLEELDDLMGNTIRAMLFYKLGLLDDLPDFFKNALNNGVLCEFDETTLDAKIKKIVYDVAAAGPLTGDLRTKEKDLAKVLPAIGECKPAPNDSDNNQCFCPDATAKTLLFCLAEKYKKDIVQDTPKKTCRKEALDALKAKGYKALGGSVEDGSATSKTKTAGDADAFIEALDEFGKLLCDASNPALDADIKAVYAADAMYWTIEAAIFTSLLGTVNLKDECAKDEVKGNPVGECTCKFEKGMSVCVLEALGNFLKSDDIKFLDCTDPAVAKTVKEKKPDVAEIKKKMSAKIAPGPPSPSGNSTTPKPAESAAAASPLLLAVQSVAAAVMLAL